MARTKKIPRTKCQPKKCKWRWMEKLYKESHNVEHNENVEIYR